jgi:hypothetical protein
MSVEHFRLVQSGLQRADLHYGRWVNSPRLENLLLIRFNSWGRWRVLGLEFNVRWDVVLTFLLFVVSPLELLLVVIPAEDEEWR